MELTEKEIETIKILIELGDSKELAIKTVIDSRERKSWTTELYEMAYYS